MIELVLGCTRLLLVAKHARRKFFFSRSCESPVDIRKMLKHKLLWRRNIKQL